MALIEINDLAKVGAIRDQEAYQLPPEAFNLADNMRFWNGGVERVGGRDAVFGTPPAAPHFLMPIESSTQVFWLYTSLTHGYVYDGSSHTDITRVSGPYTASATANWNGTLLGGIAILNDGSDVPQAWLTLNITTKLVDLPNWPVGVRADVIRSFGPFLLALNVTKAGTRYAHMVKWSHPADPGTVPISWDETDPTLDAGETDLPDVNSGVILDGLPLQGRFYVYKENSVWRMTPISGALIFSFDTFLESAGLLAPRCVTLTGDGTRHVFATQDDILVHNGNSAESVLDQRFRTFLINAIDPTNYGNSFMFTNQFSNEVWFCYPENGMSNPNRAIVWNYKTGSLYESAVNFRNAATGNIEIPDPAMWNTVVGTWDTILVPWATNIRRRVVLCGTDGGKFYQLDRGTTFDGVPFTGTLQRIGLGIVGRKRDGEWIVDFARHKAVTRIWIKAVGSPFKVRVGFQPLPDGAIAWSAYKTFDPTMQKYLDFTGSGKAFGVEFSSQAPFRVVGYKPEIMPLGKY